ncbi:unnamed protein product [Soboliphyme baturini]|uniref:Secreted protein n=1 Tax=Soboliphyme baturini TaxID=241478 RepID=A0A183IYH3_9BILA|nr:unnamed protein product [Soboliphyme baturini]
MPIRRRLFHSLFENLQTQALRVTSASRLASHLHAARRLSSPVVHNVPLSASLLLHVSPGGRSFAFCMCGLMATTLRVMVVVACGDVGNYSNVIYGIRTNHNWMSHA